MNSWNWIPVSRRLPGEDDGYVLVTNGQACGLAIFMKAEHGCYRWNFDVEGAGLSSQDITHWQSVILPGDMDD